MAEALETSATIAKLSELARRFQMHIIAGLMVLDGAGRCRNAAVLIDDEPAFGGFLSMIETDDGWRASVPIELVRDTEYWPQTRWEWSVVASMLLSIENALEDFENDVRNDQFRTLSQAAASAGRIVGESAVVQGIIYGMMKRDVDEED